MDKYAHHPLALLVAIFAHLARLFEVVMKPHDISLRSTIYKKLQLHTTIHLYEANRGLQRLFFLASGF